jgi:hypothetical protein
MEQNKPDSYEQRYNVKKVDDGKYLSSDGKLYEPWGKTGKLIEVSPSTPFTQEPLDKRAFLKSCLGVSVATGLVITGIAKYLSGGEEADSKLLFSGSETANDQSVPQPDTPTQNNSKVETPMSSSNIVEIVNTNSEIVIPDNYKEIRRVNGYTLYKEFNGENPGFSTLIEIDLSLGSQLVPVFAPRNEDGWHETYSLNQFKSIADSKTEAIISGSFFGIQNGINSKEVDGTIDQTKINYPQKSGDKIVYGWAPSQNYLGAWRSLVIRSGSVETINIPGERARELAESLVNKLENEIVITGLSLDAEKSAKNQVVRTMLFTDKSKSKLYGYIGYGTQKEVATTVLGFGANYEDIVMMDGASSTTFGYIELNKDNVPEFKTQIDIAQRDTPMVLAAIP